MARVTVEDCIDKVESPYELVLVAKERATQLNSGLEPTVDRDNDKNTVISLREIAEENIKVSDLTESAVYKLRKHVPQVDDTSEADEEIGDDFENLYKGEISKSGTPILPSKRVRRVAERINIDTKKEEDKKMWSIPNNNFAAFEEYFDKKGLFKQLVFIVKQNGIDLNNNTAASLASGTCALESLILKKYNGIQKLFCVDFSKHRIKEIALRVLDHHKIDPNIIELCLGSFYDLKIEDNSLDIVFLCQAFHHAKYPDKLLSEIRRVLKRKGKLVIIGEHYFHILEISKRVIKHFIKWIINYKEARTKSGFLPW